MYVYYILYIFLAVFSFLETFPVKRRQRLLLLLGVWLCLTLFAGLRYDNADWGAYYEMYMNIASGTSEGAADIGFNIICRVLSFFGASPIIMFLFVAGTATALNLESFKRYSPYFLICVLYYFVHIYVLKEMIQIRAGLASAICLYSVRFLEEKRTKRFWGIWLIALSMHMSAVIWVLVGIFYKRHFTPKALKWMLFVCLLVGIFYPFGQLLKTFADGIDDRLTAYIAYKDQEFASELGIFTNINTLKSLAVAMVLFVFSDKLKEVSRYFMILLYAYIAGVCWMLLFNDFGIIGGRMSGMLLCVEPVLISFLVTLLSKKSRPVFVLALVVLTLTMLTLNMGPNKITPYQFYFS